MRMINKSVDDYFEAKKDLKIKPHSYFQLFQYNF